MNKIQITEEQALELINILTVSGQFKHEILKDWKEAGYIKKSALGKARELKDKFVKWSVAMERADNEDIIAIFDAYEAVIKELRGE